MLAVKSVNVRDNFKEWCDKISMGETVVISRPRNENIYMINESEYNALQKAKRNAEYLEKINRSVELKAMESDEWEPTEKVLEFEKRHGIQRNGESAK